METLICEGTFTQATIDHYVSMLVPTSEKLATTLIWANADFGGIRISAEDRASLVHVLERLNEECRVTHDEKGTLRIDFGKNGCFIVVADGQHEAWEMYKTNGERGICMPGGEIATWAADNR